MSKFKVVGFLQVYNEIRKGNLHRFVSQIFKHVDSLVVYDNGSTDGTYELLRSRTPYIIRGHKNSFDHELIKKQKLLELALTLKPDFILWLDCDEVLAHGVDVQLLCSKMIEMELDGFALPEINLWLSETWQRMDSLYDKGMFVRLWKIDLNSPPYFPSETGLHKVQYPRGINKILNVVDCPVIHYGFANYNNLAHKYFVYRHYGQRGYNLLRILMEDGDPQKLCKEENKPFELLNTISVNPALFPPELIPRCNDPKPVIHSIERQMANIHKYRDLVYKPNVSFICLIYKSVKWLKFVYSQFLKYTDITNHEFFFVANDPSPGVLQYLQSNRIPHYVYTPTPSQKEEFYINNVYRAYNYGAQVARGDYLVFLNSDMAFSPNWFSNLFVQLRPDNCVASRLVESGKFKSGLWGIEKNFGCDVTDYKECDFVDYTSKISISDFMMDGGLFMPLLIRKSDFLKAGAYPEGNILPDSDILNPLIAYKGQSCISGDVVLMKKLETLGIKHQTVFDSIVYHFQQGETDEVGYSSESQDFSPIIVCNDYITGRNGEKVLWQHIIESQSSIASLNRGELAPVGGSSEARGRAPSIIGVDVDVAGGGRENGWEDSIRKYIETNHPHHNFIFQNASFMKVIDSKSDTVSYLQDNFVKLGYNTQVQYETLNSSVQIFANSVNIASSYPEYDIDVISVGVDEDIFRPRNKLEMRLKHNLPPDCRIGIFVGAFNKTKGIEQIRRIVGSHTSIYWILVSKLPEKPDFDFRGRSYSCMSQYLLAELYSASDFYINTSPEESLCLAAIEAILCGIPVVMNEVGFLVDLNDEDRQMFWIDVEKQSKLDNIDFSQYGDKKGIILQKYGLKSNLSLWYDKFCSLQLKLDSKKYKI